MTPTTPIAKMVASLLAAGARHEEVVGMISSMEEEHRKKQRERTQKCRDRKRNVTVTLPVTLHSDCNVTQNNSQQNQIDSPPACNVTPNVTTIYKKDSIKKGGAGGKHASRHKPRLPLPSLLAPTEQMAAHAASKGWDPPRIVREFERWCNYHRAKGSLFADWEAAWRTWIGNAIEYAQQKSAPPPPRVFDIRRHLV